MQRSRLQSALVAVVLVSTAGCGGSHSGSGVRVSVDRPVALRDVPLRITVTGLHPHERAALRATSRDQLGTPTGIRAGTQFVSSTPIRANSAGRVDLRGDAAMRVLWSLRPVGVGAGTAAFSLLPPSSGEVVSLTVDGARATIRRLDVAPGVRRRSIRHPFYGEFFAPPTHTRRPGVLLFGGSEGGLSTSGIAQLYASHGYPTLALAYFAEPGLPRTLDRIPLEYFAGALRWLRRQPGVDPAKLAVEGISRGSEAAQLLGVHYPRFVHAVIAMVPANGAGCGIRPYYSRGGGGACISPYAWTYRGRPIPSGSGPYTPFPFHDERTNGPIFLDCAGTDQLWESCPMAQAIVSRLRAHRFKHQVTFLQYPKAGHGVGDLVPNSDYGNTPLDGWSTYSNDRAAADGWPKLLGFLRSFSRS